MSAFGNLSEFAPETDATWIRSLCSAVWSDCRFHAFHSGGVPFAIGRDLIAWMDTLTARQIEPLKMAVQGWIVGDLSDG